MHMTEKFTRLAALTAVSFLLLTPAVAQTADKKEDKTVAVVNGHEIKVSEVTIAAEDILGQLPDIPPKLRYPYIVEYLVERHLLAQAAVKEGVADSDEYKRRLALYQAKALRDAYFAQTIVPTVTEEEMKKAYDAESGKAEQTERIRARHIVVASEQEAKQIRGRIETGEKFEELAKQYSLDGSKDYGGDIGYFTAPEMVPEFSKAAFALKPGEVSQPVKTDFGWHIIRLEDRKMGGAAPYDQVKTAIRNILLRKKTQEKIIALRLQSKVELRDPDLKKFAEEARKLRQKAVQEKRQKGGQPDANDAPALTDEDQQTTGGGKSDMQAPPQ
jgi:peptidyl-prolyl cis-trans isomerase C